MAAQSVHRDFAAVLDELLRDEATRRAWSSLPEAKLDYLSVVDALHDGRIVISDDTAAASYREAAVEWAAAELLAAAEAFQKADAQGDEAPPQPPTDPAEIARELGLGDGRFKGDIDALRRRFAFANHPDRVDPALRKVAMARMQIANMLIDEAKRRMARRR